MMLQRHARYMPVMEQRTLMGVISFYDVAKAVVDSQDFENRMLKAYIRDWPVEAEDAEAPKTLKPGRQARLRQSGCGPELQPDLILGLPCPAAPSATSSASPTSARATARRSAA